MRHLSTVLRTRFRAARQGALLGSLLPAALALLAVVPPAHAAASGEYRAVRGIGPAKREANGLLRVKLRDDTTLLTHGLDPKTPAAVGDVVSLGGVERQPVCASDHYQHVLYGHPVDSPNRVSSSRSAIRSAIRRMNALLDKSALLSGGRTADYKVKCDGSGEIQVDSFKSPEPGASTTFAGVAAAARNAGFDEPNADYTIFFDSATPTACGAASFRDDQRLSADNTNNTGGGYAVAFSDCWSGFAPMHENAHNQGAVQYDAPYSTGTGAHCDDGYDVMCYSDGGNKDVGLTVFCPEALDFDCRNDTYFDAAPEPGEYLASHWNLGSPLNRYIAFGARKPGNAACEDGLDNDGDGKTDYPSDSGCSSGVDVDESDAAQASALRGRGARAAARYARRRIKQKSPRARRIRAKCARRTATSFNCSVSWRVGRHVGYRGRMVVSYRAHRPGSWSGRARLRRTDDRCKRRRCTRMVRWR